VNLTPPQPSDEPATFGIMTAPQIVSYHDLLRVWSELPPGPPGPRGAEGQAAEGSRLTTEATALYDTWACATL
jgi:hypothetical protein